MFLRRTLKNLLKPMYKEAASKMSRNTELVSRLPDAHSYITCKGNCDTCSTARRQRCMTEACDDLTASVKDRKENGGTHKVIRSKALGLLRLMVADLEA